MTFGAGGRKGRPVLSQLDHMVHIPLLLRISNMGHKRHRLHTHTSVTEGILLFTLLISHSLYLTQNCTFLIISEIPHMTLLHPCNNSAMANLWHTEPSLWPRKLSHRIATPPAAELQNVFICICISAHQCVPPYVLVYNVTRFSPTQGHG